MTPLSLAQRVAQLSSRARHELAALVAAGAGDRVAPADTEGGATSLVAYYVSASGSDIAADILRQFLAQSLPLHMVPTQFVRIDQVPRTLHGKVDARALPDLVQAPTPAAPSEHAAEPMSATETQLRELWQTVLGTPRVGRNESFFDLGGDSLLAIRLLGRIRERWSVEFSMTELFDAPTVAGAAAHIDAVVWARGAGRAPVAGVDGERDEVEF
jgi:acyl carrier protein